MSIPSTGRPVIQYGGQTPHSSTILIVTNDPAEPEDRLTWITGGHVVHRTVTYGGWQPVTDNDDLALAQ